VSAEIFDALVIGGGPSGSTAAALLARAGWSVALVEQARFPRGKVCGEFLSASNLPLLQELGVAESFLEFAGPEVWRVGVFAGDHVVTAAMPGPRTANGIGGVWGRALGRDRLDTMLLERAADAGAEIWQPWSATELVDEGSVYLCRIAYRESAQSNELRARIVIAAHSSWQPGPLPTQVARPAARHSDLFAFKTHFRDAQLPADLMPLLAFPGGYAGMVQSNEGRLTVSICIRREQLERARRGAGAVKAGAAVLAHITKSCRGAREALAGARLEDDWLSAGPIQPGIRRCGFDRIFLVGNAAGEAHPVVAEGIGMAMQSARSLCACLAASGDKTLSKMAIASAQREYARVWRRSFAPRVRVAALIAHWAMRPAAVACSLPLLQLFPAALTAFARLSGKATLPAQSLAPRPCS